MSASAISMAANIAATSSSSSSSSLHFCNKISTTHYFDCSLIQTPSFFASRRKPNSNLALKIKTHFPNSSNFSLFSSSLPLLLRASAAFEDVERAADTQITEELAERVTAEIEQEEDEEEEEDDDDDEEEENEDQPQTQSDDAGRLYVGNLAYSMTSDQLTEIFAEAGRVISVEIVYDRVTDRSRGFAFVTMGSVEEAKEAIRLFDGSQVGGRTVKINFPEVPRGGEREVMRPKIRSSQQGFVDSPHKIYAGNLSWNLTSQGLKEAFGDYSGVLSAKVIYDRDTGRSRGFGFVTFASAEEAQSALNAMNEEEIEGRPLRLNIASERARPTPPRSVEKDLESGYGSSETLTNIVS